MTDFGSKGFERENIVHRQYSGIRLSPTAREITQPTIEICNESIKSISAIDQITARWKGKSINRTNAEQYAEDIALCSEIRSRCMDVDQTDRLQLNLAERKGNLYITESQIGLIADISTDGPVTVGDSKYDSIRWIVEKRDDGQVYLCKTGKLMEPNPDKGGKLEVLSWRTPVTYLEEPRPFDLSALQSKQRELLDQTLEKARRRGVLLDLSGQEEQIFQSIEDVSFFRSKLSMIFHDVGNPISIVVGHIGLHENDPKGLADKIKRTPEVIFDVMEIAHRLVHAHEEQVTIHSLREGLQQHAQTAADNERVLRGFKQPVRITVDNGVRIYNDTLQETGMLQDDDVQPLVFSHTILRTIAENCARNAAKSLEAKRRKLPFLRRAIHSGDIDPNVTIRFGIDEHREDIYVIIEDHGVGIPPELHAGFQKRVSKWSEGIEGTGVGMATLNSIVKEMCGEDPHKEPLPLRLYPDPDYENGARIILKIPLSNKIDV